MNKLVQAALFIFGALSFTLTANAQEQLPKPSQIVLSQKLIENYISVQADLNPLIEEIHGRAPYSDPKLHAEIDAIAKKHGFSDFTELDNTSFSINIILINIDFEAGEHIDSKKMYQKELEDLKSDSTIPKADQEQLIEELEKVIAMTEDVLVENVELVMQNRDKLRDIVTM